MECTIKDLSVKESWIRTGKANVWQFIKGFTMEGTGAGGTELKDVKGPKLNVVEFTTDLWSGH